jgi:protein SCO1
MPANLSRDAVTRRHLAGLVLAGVVPAWLAGCGDSAKWHAIDVSGSLPSLSFAMTRVEDGKTVTAADYRGKIVLLFFGYTNCPDECPTTLANIARIFSRLGPSAQQIRMLFVTVDPNRDTAPVLAAYVRNFAPEIVGLRGTADELAGLARRYRAVYSVSPTSKDHPYEVTHTSAIYVFDRTGKARLIIASLATTAPDIPGMVADLQRLVAEKQPRGLLARLEQLL